MSTPLDIPAYAPSPVARPRQSAAEESVHSADRLWDALAMLLIIAGTTLFLLARNGLASIAAGTHTLPPGITSWVQRADYFSAQSSLGLGIVALGVATGLAASVRHYLRRRSRSAADAAGRA